MHKLLAKQLARATGPSGQVDIAKLCELVSAAYAETDQDRQRTERSISLMVEELDQLSSRDREQLDAKLKLQNLRFEAAVENMTQGLCMFDGEENLIICNRRWLDLFGIPWALGKPGTTFRAVVEARLANGHYAGQTVDEVLAERLALRRDRKSKTFEQHLANGRIVQTYQQPMADGGWVSTFEDVTERRRAEAQIAHMSRHDALTDLPNRVLFRERMEQHLARVRRGESLAVLWLDLDHFKTVNDSLGHAVGDVMLEAIANRLRDCVQETDTVARLGGDEFAVLQVGAKQPADATVLAQRIVEALGQRFDVAGHQVVCGASVGIAVSPNDGTDPEQLLKNADLALYRAKQDGRNGFRFFEPEMDAKMRLRRNLEADLRKALAQGEFELFYQPVINLRKNEISGLEALLRWRHPERGMVSPAEFIPLAEEIGLIIPLGEWVLRKACAEAARWTNAVTVAVNLSAVQFKSKNLVATVVSALAASRLPPTRLELEITETVLMQDNEATIDVLHQFRDLGVRISMDDFGTGYSSLSYLRRFPFDKIKIDQSFVRDLAKSGDSLSIVRAVTGLGSSLGMVTTAEGVETPEQLSVLRAEGCTEVQGYVFSPPRPARDVEALLHRFSGKARAVA
jgi:diguanylate cyclase (GGDEF)-like protein